MVRDGARLSGLAIHRSQRVCCRTVSMFNIPVNTHIVACVRLLRATLLAFHYRNGECTQNRVCREVSLPMAKVGLQEYSVLFELTWRGLRKETE